MFPSRGIISVLLFSLNLIFRLTIATYRLSRLNFLRDTGPSNYFFRLKPYLWSVEKNVSKNLSLVQNRGTLIKRHIFYQLKIPNVTF